MSVKMVTCIICQEEVSKRSTLSLEALARNGRACRSHKEVKQLVIALREKQKMIENWKQADWKTKIINGVSFVRIFCTFNNVLDLVVYERFREVGYPPDLIDAIKERVAEEGGPKMSKREIQEIAAMAVVLSQRGSVKPPVNTAQIIGLRN